MALYNTKAVPAKSTSYNVRRDGKVVSDAPKGPPELTEDFQQTDEYLLKYAKGKLTYDDFKYYYCDFDKDINLNNNKSLL